MKIIIISLSGAGDVLMATPMIRGLRKRFSDAEIDVLVMQGKITKELLENNKDINKIIYFDFMKNGIVKSLKFCSRLRRRRYDLSITTYPQARLHYSVVSRIIGAKKRIGFHYETHKLYWNNLFFTELVKENFNQHVVDNNLNILGLFGAGDKSKIKIKLKKENILFADNYFRKNRIKKAVVIHPGSGTTKNFILKRWDKDKFAELCRRIDRKIILVGGEDENYLKEEIIKKSGKIANKEIFNLNENINNTAAVIKKSGLVISNDSIIAHLGAAVNAKVIGIFGPTSWKNSGPYTNKKIIIDKSSGEKYRHGSKGINKEQAGSLKKISVDDVYEAFKKS